MPIARLAGPPGASSVIAGVLADLGFGAGNAAVAGAGAQFSQPIEVFRLNVSDIQGDDFLKNARPTGWRHLVYGNGPIAVADVTQVAPGGPVKFQHLTRGVIATRLQEASLLAEAKFASASEVLEPRILEIPSFYIMALWLHGNEDVFIPFLEGTPAKDGSPVKIDTNFAARLRKTSIGPNTTKQP